MTEILIRANYHSKAAQLNQGSPQVRSQMIQTESERISETPRLDKQSFLTEHHDLDDQSDLSLVFDQRYIEPKVVKNYMSDVASFKGPRDI